MKNKVWCKYCNEVVDIRETIRCPNCGEDMEANEPKVELRPTPVKKGLFKKKKSDKEQKKFLEDCLKVLNQKNKVKKNENR